MLFEYDSLRREIYNGRPSRMTTSLGPSWMGDSIGHWEGDTLVIDTVNLNDKTGFDRVGHPHSDALHIVERFRRVNHDPCWTISPSRTENVYESPGLRT